MAETETAGTLSKVLPPVGEVVIELGTKLCQRVLFPPTGESFRGRWSDDIMKGTSSVNFPELQSLPSIPGICIALNGRQKTGRIFDPLALSEHRALVGKLQAVGKKLEGRPGAPVLSPDGPSERKHDLNDSQVKTWYYWMHRLVETKAAVEIKGEIPDMELIRSLDGKINVGSLEGGMGGRRNLEALEKFIAQGAGND